MTDAHVPSALNPARHGGEKYGADYR